MMLINRIFQVFFIMVFFLFGMLQCILAEGMPLSVVNAAHGAVSSFSAQEGVRQMSIRHTDSALFIDIDYPQFGQVSVDRDVAEWAKQLAGNIQAEFGGERLENSMPYELQANYILTRPVTDVVSVIWNVASFTGGNHGNLDVVTLSYDLRDGSPITFLDLFEDLDSALALLSAYTQEQLKPKLGDMYDEMMLTDGTLPEADNFASFALLPDVLRIYFQPYQVGPWAAGIHSVDVPLEILDAAKPHRNYWR